MKQIIRTFCTILLMILVFSFQNNVKAYDKFPTTIEATRGEHLEFSSVGMAYKYTTDNIDVYCIEWRKLGPDGVTSYMSEQFSEGVSAGLASIIRTVPDGNKEDYYYASIAVHLFVETDYEVSEEDKARVQHLVDTAKEVQNSINTFSISASSSSYTLVQSGDYFVSKVINVNKTTGDGYTVSTNNSNAEIINKTDTSFQIRIPQQYVSSDGSFNLKVTINAEKQYGTVARYKMNDDYQMVVPDIIVTSTKQKSTELNFTAKKSKISITKLDINNNPLVGATLQIFDNNGNEIKDGEGNVLYKWKSTKQPYYIEGLQAGTYILREIQAPSGYELLNKDIVFAVSSTGSVTIKEQIDEAEAKQSGLIVFNLEKTKLKVSKQDITNNKELPGATLQILDNEGNEIKDSDGNILYKWVSTEEPHYIEGLPAGEYILVETSSPDGYVLNEEKIEFELKNDGKIVSVTMKNTPIVDVPATGFNTSLFILSIGIIAIISGTIFVGLNVKKQN